MAIRSNRPKLAAARVTLKPAASSSLRDLCSLRAPLRFAFINLSCHLLVAYTGRVGEANKIKGLRVGVEQGEEWE